MRDDKLLKLLNTDPELGIRIMIDQYSGIVYSVVRSRLSSDNYCEADIEECVADTFTEFYLDLKNYSHGFGSIKSWLCIIARNNAIDTLRKRDKRLETVSLDNENLHDQADDYSLEGDFEDKCVRAELIKAIKNLGHPDSEIIMRKFYLAQSSKEISEALNLSVSNIDTRTHRALRKLRKSFGGK